MTQYPYQPPSSQPQYEQAGPGSYYPGYQGYAPPATHSTLGIIAFIMSVVALVGEFALVVWAGVMEASSPGGIDENDPVAVVVGLFLFFGILVALVGLGLGIAAVAQRDRKKLFGILAIIFSAVTILGTCGLMGLGLAMEG